MNVSTIVLNDIRKGHQKVCSCDCGLPDLSNPWGYQCYESQEECFGRRGGVAACEGCVSERCRPPGLEGTSGEKGPGPQRLDFFDFIFRKTLST